MKKKLLIGIVFIVAIIGISLGVFINKEYNKREEFLSFRDYVDEVYTPTFEKSQEHMNTATDKISNWEFTEWYLIEAGLEENFDIQRELKDAREKVTNKDVKYPDTLEYKKNILNQITLIEKELENLKNSDVSTYDLEALKTLDMLIAEDIKNLHENINEMNKILGKYYE